MLKTAKKLQSRYNLAADLARIKNAFANTAWDIKGVASEIVDQSIENTREKVSNFTTTKPLRTLGVAVLAGILIGVLVRK